MSLINQGGSTSMWVLFIAISVAIAILIWRGQN